MPGLSDYKVTNPGPGGWAGKNRPAPEPINYTNTPTPMPPHPEVAPGTYWEDRGDGTLLQVNPDGSTQIVNTAGGNYPTPPAYVSGGGGGVYSSDILTPGVQDVKPLNEEAVSQNEQLPKEDTNTPTGQYSVKGTLNVPTTIVTEDPYLKAFKESYKPIIAQLKEQQANLPKTNVEKAQDIASSVWQGMTPWKEEEGEIQR